MCFFCQVQAKDNSNIAMKDLSLFDGVCLVRVVCKCCPFCTEVSTRGKVYAVNYEHNKCFDILISVTQGVVKIALSTEIHCSETLLTVTMLTLMVIESHDKIKHKIAL